MKISTKGKYGVEALVYIAHVSHGEAVSLTDICKATNISTSYLEQIFFALRKSNILKAVRGIKGGYLFARPINKITVGEILRTLEGELTYAPCAKNQNNCTCEIQDICSTNFLWCDMSLAIDEVVDHITLEDLRIHYQVVLTEVYGDLEYYI